METWIIQLLGIAIQTMILGGGALIVIGGAKNQLANLDKRVDRVEIAVIQVARQDERLNAMDQRMLAQGKRIDRIENAQDKEDDHS